MKIWKIVFWTCTILLGFVNPLISVSLIILYYFPGIIHDVCKPCNNIQDPEMNSFSKDVMEEMR